MKTKTIKGTKLHPVYGPKGTIIYVSIPEGGR